MTFLGLSWTLTENTKGSKAGTTWKWVISKSLSLISWSKTGLQTYQITKQEYKAKILILHKLLNSNRIQGIHWTLFIKLKLSLGGMSLRWVRLKAAHLKLLNLLLQEGRWIIPMTSKGLLPKIEARCRWRKNLGKIKCSCRGSKIMLELKDKEVEFLEILKCQNQITTTLKFRWKTSTTLNLSMNQNLRWAHR